MVVFDCNMLIALVADDTSADDRARLEHLVATLAEQKQYVGIPAPAFSEFMVDAEQATSEVLATLRRKQWIRFLPFDEAASIEAALITRQYVKQGKKRGASKKTWQEIKFDRQIVAIAKVNRATAIYSDDAGLRSEARALGIQAHALSDLPIPPEARQMKIALEPKGD